MLINLRVQEEEKARWVRAASLRGLSLSGLIRVSVEREIGAGPVSSSAPVREEPVRVEPAKKKIALPGGCLMSVPRGVRCKVCGKLH